MALDLLELDWNRVGSLNGLTVGGALRLHVLGLISLFGAVEALLAHQELFSVGLLGADVVVVGLRQLVRGLSRGEKLSGLVPVTVLSQQGCEVLEHKLRLHPFGASFAHLREQVVHLSFLFQRFHVGEIIVVWSLKNNRFRVLLVQGP